MKMKVWSFTAKVLLSLMVLMLLNACDESSKPITSLQIFGLNTEVYLRGEFGSPAESQEYYFLYYFVPVGKQPYFRISHVTQADYEASNIQNPLEANVGQFGLWAIS